MCYVNVKIPDSNVVVVVIEKANLREIGGFSKRYIDICFSCANEELACMDETKGVLFLNELLADLKTPLLSEGQVMGWKRKKMTSLHHIRYEIIQEDETELIISIPTDGVVVDELDSSIVYRGKN